MTGKEYLYIDIANQYGNGLDKSSWEDRINWVDSNLSKLESLIDEADDKYLFVKAIYALRDTQRGISTGFIMGMDK